MQSSMRTIPIGRRALSGLLYQIHSLHGVVVLGVGHDGMENGICRTSGPLEFIGQVRALAQRPKRDPHY